MWIETVWERERGFWYLFLYFKGVLGLLSGKSLDLVRLELLNRILSFSSQCNEIFKISSHFSQKSQNMLITEISDHSTLSKNNVEEYINSIATDPNLRGMLYHNLLQRNAILNQHNEKVCGTRRRGENA